MPDISFRGPVQRAGAKLVQIPVALGNLTANSTTNFDVPLPFKKCYVVSAAYVAGTIAADADGTTLGTLFKYRGATDDEVTISSAFDLETAVARETSALVVNGGDAARTCQRLDTLRFKVVNNSAALNTQHANAFLLVELAVLE